jgi:hypothetical protein
MYTAVVEKGLRERNTGHFTDIQFICGVIKDNSGTFPCTPAAARATISVAHATHASKAPWEQDVVMLTSQYSSIHTRNVVIKCIGFIALARHDENVFLEHRFSVGGTQCEPPVQITLQEELLTEMMRIYSCAVDVEVEDKSGHLDRRGEQHALSHDERPRSKESEPFGPATMNEPVCQRLRGSILLGNRPFQVVQIARN